MFNRLNRKGEGEPSDRARMRMDAVPAERIDDVTLDPSPEPSPQAKVRRLSLHFKLSVSAACNAQ